MIMKGCVQWNPVYDWKDSRLKRGSSPGPLDQQASASSAELPRGGGGVGEGGSGGR